jgi:hypothetical protein
MDPTPEQVWIKVQELYSSTTAHDQRTATDAWLKAYQQSPSAWDSLAFLLRAEGQGLDPMELEQVHFFAANTLRFVFYSIFLKSLDDNVKRVTSQHK